jgi:hypothetical protein
VELVLLKEAVQKDNCVSTPKVEVFVPQTREIVLQKLTGLARFTSKVDVFVLHTREIDLTISLF